MPGIIHAELDIKILILYTLRRLSGPIDPTDLFDLCLSETGIDYFDYSGCLSDLIDREMIEQDEDGFYSITQKGSRNGETVESSLPYSVRNKMDRMIAPINEKIQRASLVKAASHREPTGIIADLSMSDGIGNLIELHILCADEAQAAVVRKNFKNKAEYFYTQFIKELSEE